MKILGICLSLLSTLPIFAGTVHRVYFPSGGENIIMDINNELAEKYTRPNNQGWFLTLLPPRLSNTELTDWIKFSISFTDRKFTRTEEAEKLYVTLYEEFLTELNNIRHIRPFFYEFPITPATMHLYVHFRDKTLHHLPQPYICVVCYEQGNIEFCHTVQKFTTHIVYKTPEPYNACEPFLKKPAKSMDGIKELYRPKLLPYTGTEKPVIPCFTTVPWDCKNFKSDIALYNFIQNFGEQHNLKLIIIGGVGDGIYEHRAFNFALRGEQTLPLKEARILGSTCAKNLLETAQNDKDCINLIIKRRTDPHYKEKHTTPQPEHLAFRISFWDEYVDRVPNPYIAEIRLFDNQFQYFTSNEHQQLVLVHKETFDEAMAFLEKESSSDI